MSPETITWIWLGAGIALMLAEFAVPGAVVIFLGLAAVMVAGLRWIGLIDELMSSFTAWFILSLAMVIGLRSLVGRFTSSDRTVQPTDEDLAAFGKEVEVTARVGDDLEGRVRFSGTTWPARSLKGPIEPGGRARIVDRENLALVVEPLPGTARQSLETQGNRTPNKGGS